MAKLTTLWQSIRVEYISLSELEYGLLKIGGTVIDSNFLDQGRRSLMPIFAEKTANILSVGDLMKITLYTPKGHKEFSEDDGTKTLTFRDCGTRYEIWNKKAQGWDKIFEIFSDKSLDD